MGKFSNKEKAAEARRELAQRSRVYPRRVAEGKMHADAARRQTALMEEIAADYEAKDASDRPDLFTPSQEEGFQPFQLGQTFTYLGRPCVVLRYADEAEAKYSDTGYFGMVYEYSDAGGRIHRACCAPRDLPAFMRACSIGHHTQDLRHD